MGFSNEINAAELGREGSVGKDKCKCQRCCYVLTDPSRERSQVLIQCAKPILMAQLYDSDQALWTTDVKENTHTYYFFSAFF
jgi:hypothetical protein